MPEQAKRLLGEVHQDAGDVVTAVNGLVASQSKTRKVIAALIVSVVVGALFVVLFVRYSTCATNRGNALNGPGNARINLFFDAYTNAAGAIDHPLSEAERAKVIAELDKARDEFNLIPSHAKLVKQEDGNLLGIQKLIGSLHANAEYNAASADHPVCSLWSFG